MTDDMQPGELEVCRYCHGQFQELTEKCPWCGKAIALYCENCGQLTDNSNPTCVHCGQTCSPRAETPEPTPAPLAGLVKAAPAAPSHIIIETPAPPAAAPKEPPVVIVQAAPAAPPAEPPTQVVATWRELRGPWRIFVMSEWIMRDRASFFEEIRARRNLTPKLRGMVASSILYLAVYGLVMGSSNSWQQALVSAIKLPALFLVTLLICLPTLYFFNLLYGSQLTFAQTAALIMSAVTVTAALALAFASITSFFWLTVPDYEFFVVLNVGVLAITAWWGLALLREGVRHVQPGQNARARRILLIWITIYAFVGTQMAWALRPFFGYPGAPFELIRRMQGTFYTGLFNILRGLLGF